MKIHAYARGSFIESEYICVLRRRENIGNIFSIVSALARFSIEIFVILLISEISDEFSNIYGLVKTNTSKVEVIIKITENKRKTMEIYND